MAAQSKHRGSGTHAGEGPFDAAMKSTFMTLTSASSSHHPSNQHIPSNRHDSPHQAPVLEPRSKAWVGQCDMLRAIYRQQRGPCSPSLSEHHASASTNRAASCRCPSTLSDSLTAFRCILASSLFADRGALVRGIIPTAFVPCPSPWIMPTAILARLRRRRAGAGDWLSRLRRTPTWNSSSGVSSAPEMAARAQLRIQQNTVLASVWNIIVLLPFDSCTPPMSIFAHGHYQVSLHSCPNCQSKTEQRIFCRTWGHCQHVMHLRISPSA